MFYLTQQAYKDLKLIAVYTEENWGKNQCVLYMKMMDEAFHRLSKEPKQGVKIDYIRKGYYKYLIGKHLIFYRIVSGLSFEASAKKKGDVQIVRILHQRMDVETYI
ncbi:MAG: type II toxin-antitoxin system RelE/ParE family toxin [Alphaproteobacteria bacterium]|nr:type II toxin-antitoxin system RelE/ParE family toxin [Alphaproteobacteria bacterium]MCL2505193.1 type II toxin-antitoxin system RelE/ParE family toxin [Alphaproteobacteria bacterium]